jgi:hypothetical protein
MADSVDEPINDTVVADTDTPIALAASEFAASGRARIRCQPLHRSNDALMDFGQEPTQIFLRSAFKQDAIHRHLRLRPAR